VHYTQSRRRSTIEERAATLVWPNVTPDKPGTRAAPSSRHHRRDFVRSHGKNRAHGSIQNRSTQMLRRPFGSLRNCIVSRHRARAIAAIACSRCGRSIADRSCGEPRAEQHPVLRVVRTIAFLAAAGTP
jgi:hypothetical protein